MALVVGMFCDLQNTELCGRWRGHMDAGRWYRHFLYKGIYISLSSGMLNRTSSHTCGRWNFPVILMRDGPLTLMYSDSILVIPPTVLKLSTVLV